MENGDMSNFCKQMRNEQVSTVQETIIPDELNTEQKQATLSTKKTNSWRQKVPYNTKVRHRAENEHDVNVFDRATGTQTSLSIHRQKIAFPPPLSAKPKNVFSGLLNPERLWDCGLHLQQRLWMKYVLKARGLIKDVNGAQLCCFLALL